MLGLAVSITQVVWRRALRLSLGGSETLGAMVVVIAFLRGLGLGAALAGRRVGALKNPLLGLGLIELGLAGVNLVVTLILSLDLSASVTAAQGLASAAGLPMRAVYALATSVLLLPPTLMMGATLPLAGAARQPPPAAHGAARYPWPLFGKRFLI